MITFKQFILESKKIITSPEQYGDPGMRYVVEATLRKYKGKVSREFLDWIKNNIVKVFPYWHYNYYKNQEDATIDEIFYQIAIMRMHEKEENGEEYSDNDEAFNSVTDEILDILLLSKENEKKRLATLNKDNPGIEMDI